MKINYLPLSWSFYAKQHRDTLSTHDQNRSHIYYFFFFPSGGGFNKSRERGTSLTPIDDNVKQMIAQFKRQNVIIPSIGKAKICRWKWTWQGLLDRSPRKRNKPFVHTRICFSSSNRRQSGRWAACEEMSVSIQISWTFRVLTMWRDEWW